MDIKIVRHDDSEVTVHLPAFQFEIQNKDGSAEALVNLILERVREELEDNFEISVRFIGEGAP